MALFLQFDVQKKFGLPLVSKSHLSVFQCPAHNGPPRNQWGGWGARPEPTKLPSEYWRGTDDPDVKPREASYVLMLNQPTNSETVHAKDSFVVHKSLTFEKIDEVVKDNGEDRAETPAIARAGFPGTSALPWDDEHGHGYHGLERFKVGGHPVFLQKTEKRACACGAEMILLCQIPDPYRSLELSRDAPKEPRVLARIGDNLFNGLFVTIFACERQCSPFALHAEGQR